MRTIFTLAAVLLPTSLAAAADFVPDYTVPDNFNWTGAYVGVSLGHANAAYAVTDATGEVAPEDYIDAFNGDFELEGWVLGGQLGYNYQLDNNIVLGVQGLILLPDLEGGYAGIREGDDEAIANVNVKVDWVAGLVGTVGYSFDRAMIYGGGGLAAGGVTVGVNGVGEQVDLTAEQTHLGWMATIGVAYALTDNVVATLDYSRIDLGTKTYELAGTIDGNTSDVTAEGGGAGNLIRAGLNFKF
jgi:outer membrane immunogenic protein